MIKKLSAVLAVILLLTSLISCKKKEAFDPASMKYGELYLSVKKIGNSTVKSYSSSVPNVRQNPVKSKDVIIHGIAYTMTMTDLEDVVSSDGILLSSRDTYFKAGSSDGSSPKIKALYEYDTSSLIEFSLDSKKFYESIGSESDLVELFNNVLTSNVSYASAVVPQIVSFVGEDASTGYQKDADFYIVTFSEDLCGHHLGGATMTLTKNGFQFFVNMQDVKKYEPFLEKHSTADIVDTIREKLKDQIGEDLVSTLNVDKSKLIFTLVGGRPCFSFDASLTVNKKQVDFNGYLFIR